MKTSLVLMCLLMLAIGSIAQPLTMSQSQIDSLNSSYKKHKTTGLILLPVGGAAFLAGAVVIIGASMSETGDDLGNGLTELFGGTSEPKKDYSGQYTTGALLMIGGAVLSIVGVTQLTTARKIRKATKNVSLSFSPTLMPALKGGANAAAVTQSTLTLKIPLGK